MPMCRVCGKQNPAGAEYCEACGVSASSLFAATAASGDALAAAAPVAEQVSTMGSSVGAGDTGEGTGGGASGRPRLLPKRYGAPTGDEIPLLGERLLVGR